MFWDTVLELSSVLDNANVAYCLLNTSALFAQGVLRKEPQHIEISIQWDAMERVYEAFAGSVSGGFKQHIECSHFDVVTNDILVTFVCYYNTVVVTDPYRIRVETDNMGVWVKSLYYYHQKSTQVSDENRTLIEQYLRGLQDVNGQVNQEAWNQNTYDAWVNRHGTPQEAASKIAKNPLSRLHPWSKHLGSVSGTDIMNLLGSHGGRAVALALLGANVSVVDISETNKSYALDVAKEAGVDIDYIVADVLDLPMGEMSGQYDIVLLELGVLHYFVDLNRLFQVVSQLLRAGGRFILHEFHPISTKLITSTGKKHKVTGNYFDFAMETRSVAHAKYGGSAKQTFVHLRKWTIGEIISSVADSDLQIVRFEEEPNHKIDDIGIPKTFTLVAQKVC